MNYGVTNIRGQVDDNEISKIIKYAIENNINFFDTSQSYGESQERIGQFLS